MLNLSSRTKHALQINVFFVFFLFEPPKWEGSFSITIYDLYFSRTTCWYYTNTVKWHHHMRLMLQIMPPPFSLSLLVSSSSLTDATSESVPVFFCSDFCEDIFVDLNWKRFLAAARFEPSTFQSNTWRIRPQDHGVLLRKKESKKERKKEIQDRSELGTKRKRERHRNKPGFSLKKQWSSKILAVKIFE